MVVVCQGCDGRFSDENHLQQHIYSDSNYACLLAYSKENQPQQKRSSRSKSVPVPSKRKRTIIEIAEQALNFSTEGDQRRARNDDQLSSASSSLPSSSKVSTAGIASLAIERPAPPVPTAANRTAIEYAGTARFCEFKAYIDNATIHHIGLTPSQTAAVQVMSIMDRKGGSIALYNEVMEWHASHSGGKHKTVHADKLYKELLERYHLRNVLPQVVPVHLESIGSTVPLVVHDCTSQLIDLLSDPRIQQEDYLFPGGFPGGKIPETQEILGDIITGESYRATYKELIEPEPMTACGRQKVLLPMLLYMDGCATGQTMNGEVEILKFTIGILKLSARRNWWAWRELGLTTKPLKGRGLAKQMMTDSDHLDAANYLSSCSNSDKYGGGPLKEGYDPTGCIGFGVDVGIDNREDGEVNSQDLHRMLHIMMESYKVLEGGFPWDMPWDGSIKRLLLVPYIELACLDGKAGDQFAQTYLTKTGVQCLCRICVCPTEWSDEAYREDDAYKTVPMIQKLVQDRNREQLKAISQQCCQNFSWGLKFGSHNNRGIYGATPPDTLHQLQLNLFGNTRDNFFDQIGASSALGKEINALVTLVGEYMKRQSDRDLPRTSFSRDAQSGVLMGHEMVGLLLVISGAIRTTAGRAKILNMSHGKARELFRVDDGTHIDRWSTYLDTLLEYEAFLKQPKMKASSVERMKTKIKELMNMIVKVGRRSKGMGCNTATHHTAKHLPQAILDHGVPENFNVFDMERHHRPDKKTAQRTQKHPETFNYQMAVKKIHRRAIELAMEETNGNKRWHYLLPQTEKETKLPGAKSTVELTGVSVRVSLDNEGSVVQVVGESPNRKQYKHSESVLSAVGGILMECAEHLKALKVHDCIKLHNGPEDSQIYRASPLYQGKPWYDWAMFDLRGPSEEDWNSKTRVPCQIRCFVDMRCLSLLAAQETQYEACVYAVVEPTAPGENILEQRRSVIWKPHVKKAHSLVPNENQTLILPVSRIVEPAALIPDHGNLNKRAYLRLTRRKYWAELFENWLDEEHTRSWDDSDEEFEAADAEESDIEISAALDKPGDISADELADILEMSEECRRDIRAEQVSDVCSPVTRSMNTGSTMNTGSRSTTSGRRRAGRTGATTKNGTRRTGAR